MNKYIFNDKEEEKMERQGLMKKNLAVILALVMIFTMFIPAATGRGICGSGRCRQHRRQES